MTDDVLNDIRERLIRIEESVKGQSKRLETVEDTVWGKNRDNGLVSSVQGLALKASLATGVIVILGNFLIGKVMK